MSDVYFIMMMMSECGFVFNYMYDDDDEGIAMALVASFAGLDGEYEPWDVGR